jgi:hypothetical protein
MMDKRQIFDFPSQKYTLIVKSARLLISSSASEALTDMPALNHHGSGYCKSFHSTLY